MANYPKQYLQDNLLFLMMSPLEYYIFKPFLKGISFSFFLLVSCDHRNGILCANTKTSKTVSHYTRLTDHGTSSLFLLSRLSWRGPLSNTGWVVGVSLSKLDREGGLLPDRSFLKGGGRSGR